MAGLKKKKKEKSGSPNVVLVVFLVLFVISTITLGVLLYYALDEKVTAQRAEQNAKKDITTEKATVTYYRMLYRDAVAALGKLDPKDAPELVIDRESFVTGKLDGVAKNDKEATLKLHQEFKASLGDTTPLGFRDNYPKLLSDANDKIKELDGKANAEAQAHANTKATLKTISDNQTKTYNDVRTTIDDMHRKALAKAQERSDDFKKNREEVVKLNTELIEKGKEISKINEDHENAIKLKDFLIRKITAERDENRAAGGPGGAPVATRVDTSMPLLLDVSTGKPLWDQPVAKITRVDLDLRQVMINIGSAHGVQPELTFNVFGANAAGRAEKSMKGSIEVIKVLDTNSSLARITSLYDVDGHEIPLGLQTRGRVLRESESPLREGDLLFNMFWGTRVAISGYVSITGEASDNPSEQIRHMEDFLFLLKRNGVTVDAWVDLRDGKIQGNISSKTRYLIKGNDLRVAGEKPPAKMADEDKEAKEKDGKEKEPAAKDPMEKNGQANAERNELINKSSQMLRNDAKAQGLLMISAENFVTVIGYRKARNANNVEISGFRPTLPYAGVDPGAVRQAPPEMPPMPEAPKKEDKKDEKKDDQ